jgi:murein DD-endopeptidase MepM/ murein hydrolase activator NlpD
MGTKPNIEDGLPNHRPLPSVDLALLPHERRAVRIRNTVGVSFVLLAIGGGGALYIFSSNLRDFVGTVVPSNALKKNESRNDEKIKNEQAQLERSESAKGTPLGGFDDRQAPREPESELIAAMQPVVLESKQIARSIDDSETEPGKQQIVKRFGKARGFRDALIAAGASADESNALIAALNTLVNFRHCHPEHELVFERDQDNRLVQFEYRVSTTEIYRVARTKEGKLKGRVVDVPIEKHRFSKGGYISKSLRQALEGVGLSGGFAGTFVEVFEGHIDFNHEYVNGSFLGIGTVHALEYRSQRKGKLQAFWYEFKKGKGVYGDYYNAKGRTMQGGWLRTPVQYDHISSKFNPRRRHPILKRIIPHYGIDYAASPGTPVKAAADGTVSYAGFKGANGNLVVINHSNGCQTFYAHLLRIARGIRSRVKVEQRQVIGSVGSTGLSTGPHLHFAVKRAGRFIDPASQLNGPGKPLPASEESKYRRIRQRMVKALEKIPLAAAPEEPEKEASTPRQEKEKVLGSESLEHF